MLGEERANEIKLTVEQYGVDAAAEMLGLSRTTIVREARRARNKDAPKQASDLTDSANGALVKKLFERFTPEELRSIVNGKSFNPNQTEKPIIKFSGEDVVIGFVTDTHAGSTYFQTSLWKSFLEECKIQHVKMILHSGDVHEGMSNRPDQMYQLTHLGSSKQMDYVESLFNMTDIPIYCIDGNHDRWAMKSAGLNMVEDVAKRCDHVHYLGSDSADVNINGSSWRLWHGEDGSSYATSYRIQKVIESLTGGDKPDVLLLGHTHKQAYIFERNIHAVSGGALCMQSAWMKAKRLPNHTGFHILRAKIRDGKIVCFSPTFYPFYF